jgi:uncharacterized protein (DUF488 family)
MTIFTIGHSTRTLEALIAALASAGVDCVADVRRFPRSRRHPHFNVEALAQALPEAGIAYRHFEALGGRRSGAKAATAASPNDLWREAPFRAYADYAATPDFSDALDALRDLAKKQTVAIMCAEAVWWRCHRRIIADYLLAGGADVVHIMDKGKLEPARLTEGAVPRPDGTVLYAADQGRLEL